MNQNLMHFISIIYLDAVQALASLVLDLRSSEHQSEQIAKSLIRTRVEDFHEVNARIGPRCETVAA
ncbi:hypothetical protein FHR53_000397 [Xanthomonas arboricola]|uniref:hypothetical protein n=1 Tax=Xanthomonas TaxID=338 RepID=UPI00142FDE92|nr:hypothetical protein [Xanthomonas euroxanthea]MCC4609592.1 hypothetical protein [Xanthomonas campestris pv. zinniae]NJC37690.1 hypothetical protein [Xanthomonas euroxanthea]